MHGFRRRRVDNDFRTAIDEPRDDRGDDDLRTAIADNDRNHRPAADHDHYHYDTSAGSAADI